MMLMMIGVMLFGIVFSRARQMSSGGLFQVEKLYY